MTVLPIIQPDNPLLRCKARRVTDFGADFQALVDDMVETMLDAPGVGLAGPQVARSLRIVVAQLPADDERQDDFGEDAGQLYIVANPIITMRSAELASQVEGCLSLPGLLGEVERHESIEVTGQDRMGETVCHRMSGWLARIFQHEIDHLDGILYIDIASRVWSPEPEDEAELAAEMTPG